MRKQFPKNFKYTQADTMQYHTNTTVGGGLGIYSINKLLQNSKQAKFYKTSILQSM